MPMLTEVGTSRLSAPWRAACVILCEQFADDEQVWTRVAPGESIDLTPLLRNHLVRFDHKVLLAVAQGIIDGRTVVPVHALVNLSDVQLRSVLDALAIARGGLPID